MANWIKLYFDVDKNNDYYEFEALMTSGKKGKQKRHAEDAAFAYVIRLYLMLGKTKEGKLNMRRTGDRRLAEEAMHEEGDDLFAVFDRMASTGIIKREEWAHDNVVTTSTAQAQAAARVRSKIRSDNANEAKRAKAARISAEENLEGEP